jgi:predicted outer membrane repeat protein
VTIDDSTFSTNSGGLGGVIHVDGGSVVVSTSTFSSNSALNGGVLYARDGAYISSTNNTFQNNMASQFGGVYDFLFGVTFVESGSTYNSNQSTGSYGGVLYANHNATAFIPNEITISDAVFEFN